jgi:glucose 1-dehydrogenase
VELEGKRALVTGAAVRIGSSLALALAEAGCDVFVHYGRSAAPARLVAQQIERLGRLGALGSADLRDPMAPAQLVASAVEALGGLDILVNSAALFFDGGLSAVSLAGFDEQVAVNLRAPLFLCQAFVEHLRSTGARPAAILNVADARAQRAGSDHLVYRLSKSALITLTGSLALELAPMIRVNCLSPGAILAPPGASPGHLDELATTRIPLRRPGSAGDLSASALHLLRSDFLTGVVLPVDGGEFL